MWQKIIHTHNSHNSIAENLAYIGQFVTNSITKSILKATALMGIWPKTITYCFILESTYKWTYYYLQLVLGMN